MTMQSKFVAQVSYWAGQELQPHPEAQYPRRSGSRALNRELT
jgi:hypothetical protein